jgi:hypothetical protein
VLPGQCAGASNGALIDCLDGRVACLFCQATNRASRPIPAIDCDLFDDGTANASCA